MLSSFSKIKIHLTPWPHTRIYRVSRDVEITLQGTIRKYTHACDMELHYVRGEKGSPVISIFRKNYEMENKPPHLRAAKVTGMLQRGLYPVECIVDAGGNWIGINNMQEIRKNWKQRAAQVQKAYTGEAIESVLEIMENHLSRETALLEALQKDLLHTGLFVPIYQEYTEEEKNNEEIQVPLPGIGQITARGSVRVENETEEKICLRFTGKPDSASVEAEELSHYFDTQGIEYDPAQLAGDIECITEIENQPFTSRTITVDLSYSDQWKYREKVQYHFKRISIF